MSTEDWSGKSNWIGMQTGGGSWLGPMALELTFTNQQPGAGTINGSGLLVIFFSMAGTWASPVLSAQYNGMSITGTLAGVGQDPAPITGTINSGTSITIGGSIPPFGNASWNLIGIQPTAQQITGVWSGTFGNGQSLDLTLLQQSDNSVVGIGTLDIIIQGNLQTINVVANGTAKYPSFSLTISTINPQFFSVGLTGTAAGDNSLQCVIATVPPAPLTLTRQTPSADGDDTKPASLRNMFAL